jgi:transcriptional regulator with XRE-family HTH domain
MTYGEILRTFRAMAGIDTKSEFSRMLGLKDPDHYIGAENDAPGKRPSLDILEKAAQLAGINFQDCLRIPAANSKKVNKEDEKLHRQLQEILDRKDEAAMWISGNITTFHRAYVVSKVRGRRRRPSK